MLRYGNWHANSMDRVSAGLGRSVQMNNGIKLYPVVPGPSN
jgi:hypothetical protein